MNIIILYTTSIILKVKPKVIRIITASLIGSIYAIIAYTTEISIYTSIISKWILAIVIVYIAFNPQTVKKMCKQVLIFYLTSFVFGGVALYLIYFLKPQEIFIKNGVYVGKYVLKVRSDLYFKDANFLSYFDKYNCFEDKYRIFEKSQS